MRPPEMRGGRYETKHRAIRRGKLSCTGAGGMTGKTPTLLLRKMRTLRLGSLREGTQGRQGKRGTRKIKC